MSRLVCGWGVNDADYPIQIRRTLEEGGLKKKVTEFDCPFYKRWSLMVMRCHDEKFRARNPAYSNATICEQWKSFSAFRAWMESMPWQGNELDKDILGDGTHYSPVTCCFVPKSVNVFWTNCTSKTGVLVGANFAKDRGNWVSRCTIANRKKTLGVFHSELEAHQAWIRAKSQALTDLLAPLDLDERIVAAMHNKLRAFEIQAAQLKATA